MKTAAIVALLTTGCSFIGVRGPPAKPRRGPLTCTTSKALPVVDGVGVVFGIGMLGLGVVVSNLQTDSVGARTAGGRIILLGTVASLAYLLSMASGMSNVSACRDAKDADRAEAQKLTNTAAAAAQEHARGLPKAAAAAARAGDCKTVRKIDLELLGLDSAFHANVFLTDVDIKRCYKPAVTPSIDPAPAPQAPPPLIPVQL